MSMRFIRRYRGWASLMGLLVLLHLGSGFLHPCCLGGMGGDASPETEMADAHAGHGSDVRHDPVSHGSAPASDSDGCEGTCGLCCQTVDQVALTTVATVAVEVALSGPVEPARLASAVLPAPPAFLLPPSTAPPALPAHFG